MHPYKKMEIYVTQHMMNMHNTILIFLGPLSTLIENFLLLFFKHHGNLGHRMWLFWFYQVDFKIGLSRWFCWLKSMDLLLLVRICNHGIPKRRHSHDPYILLLSNMTKDSTTQSEFSLMWYSGIFKILAWFQDS